MLNILLGLVIGVVFMMGKRKIEEWKASGSGFTVCGVRIAFVTIQNDEVMEIPAKEEKTLKTANKALCEFCEGNEEIKLAGQKIKCPKCKGLSAVAK